MLSIGRRPRRKCYQLAESRGGNAINSPGAGEEMLSIRRGQGEEMLSIRRGQGEEMLSIGRRPGRKCYQFAERGIKAYPPMRGGHLAGHRFFYYKKTLADFFVTEKHPFHPVAPLPPLRELCPSTGLPCRFAACPPRPPGSRGRRSPGHQATRQRGERGKAQATQATGDTG